MGYHYNSACTDQTCSANCCNYYGTCPNYSSSSNYDNQCWYTYTDYDGQSCSHENEHQCCYSASQGYYKCERPESKVGTIVGAVVGGVIGLVLLIALIVFLRRRCKQNEGIAPVAPGGNVSINDTVISGSDQNMHYGPTPPYGQPTYAYPPSNGHINNNSDPSPYPPYVAQLNTYPQKK